MQRLKRWIWEVHLDAVIRVRVVVSISLMVVSISWVKVAD
jgi:hypothetical protein